MWTNMTLFEGIVSLFNVVSLIIIVLSLEKNLRTNWILKDELNMFSVLLFLALGSLLLREVLFLWGIIGGLFVGLDKSFTMISSTTPWLIINSILSLTLICTALIMVFKKNKVFVVNKSGKIWFRVINGKGDA